MWIQQCYSQAKLELGSTAQQTQKKGKGAKMEKKWEELLVQQQMVSNSSVRDSQEAERDYSC